MEEIKRGQIYWAEDSFSEYGVIQKKSRPAIVVSNDKNNTYSSDFEVVYLTTKPKADLPTHCTIRSARRFAKILPPSILMRLATISEPVRLKRWSASISALPSVSDSWIWHLLATLRPLPRRKKNRSLTSDSGNRIS